jgi:signal transduction histidine kinase
LSIVSDLIDAAGGTIQLSSRLGFGTSVDVRLPIAGAEDRQSDNPAIQFWQLAAE